MILTMIWMRHGEKSKPYKDSSLSVNSYRQLRNLGNSLGGKAEKIVIFYGPSQKQWESHLALIEGIKDVNDNAKIIAEEEQRLADVVLESNVNESLNDPKKSKSFSWRMVQANLIERKKVPFHHEPPHKIIERYQGLYYKIVENYSSSEEDVLVIAIGSEPALTFFFQHTLKENRITLIDSEIQVMPAGEYFKVILNKNKLIAIEPPSLEANSN